MPAPASTYRLQLSAAFGFADAAEYVPYLARLGVSTLYLSPVLAARKGSEHGYDVTDPTRVNPELGTPDDFRHLVDVVQRHDLDILLDIVPNHMAINHENQWWVETLAMGRHAPHANIFDINWDSSVPGLYGKVLLPFLGKPLADVLDAGELSLHFDGSQFWINYFEHRFPLSSESVQRWLEQVGTQPEPGSGVPATLLRELRGGVDSLAAACRDDESLRRYVQDLVDLVNNGNGHVLEPMLAAQHYRLAYWRTAVDEINYRRFFTITDLIGVRAEDEDVFRATHDYIRKLVNEGGIGGLRIDHIDGLARPREYLDRLRREFADRMGQPLYLVVEKILCGDECLPGDWPVDGTTGYEFLDRVNRLFIDGKGLNMLQSAYREFTNTAAPYEDVRYEKKKGVVDSLFSGELSRLAEMLNAIAATDRLGQDISENQLAIAIRELTVCLDVYRTYLNGGTPSENDRHVVERALDEVPRRNALVDPHTLRFIRRVLLDPDDTNEPRQHFIRRWQQFTGPVMAKGLEDTTHYSYFPLCSLNDVGSEANAPALDLDAFHHWNIERMARREKGLNATSTHDTKRSEDVRARINVLSEIPDWWRKAQLRWRQWNEPKRVCANGLTVPDPVFETLIYQTLLGVWPLDSEEIPSTIDRIKQYLVKAARERKEYTRWIATNVSYEDAVRAFVDAILDDREPNRFLKEFRRQQRRIAQWGHLNALSQLLLKITCPGVPDFYRGTELWDLSLVDPDNRRPVDLARRNELLNELDEQIRRRPKALFQELNARWWDGRLKLLVTARGLRCRREFPDLFLNGTYHPLHAQEDRREHVCAFARRLNGRWAIAAVPRLVVSLSRVPKTPLGRAVWGEDRLPLSSEMPIHWRDALTGERLRADGVDTQELPLRSLFRFLPVALLVSENTGP